MPSTAAVAQPSPDRPCDGCPPRRVGTAILQATYINVLYGLGNLVRGEETAKVTPDTWWKNMRHGWEWDLNDFTVNQFGHPYQGSNYFTAGRANGLSYWESAALAAFGSATWEYFGETNDASLNDFINTTLGGIALGEMFHRTAWLIRDPTATGRSRLMKEIAATAIDPLTGANRFISGDASLVSGKPAGLVPASLGAVGSAGVLWHGGENGGFEQAEVNPFLEVDLLYGDVKGGRSRTPYDAFAVRLAFGGGRPMSEARVRGRLIGQALRGGAHVSVSQGYQYANNDAYRFGAQSVDLNAGFTRGLSSSVSLWVMASGGVTVLGAADSVPLTPAQRVSAASSTGSSGEPTTRDYDYGPGSNASVVLALLRGSRTFFEAAWELHHLHVIDGIRANHLLQRARVDLNVPVRGPLGIGVSGDYFNRHTFYQSGETSHTRFPQIRLFVSWSVP